MAFATDNRSTDQSMAGSPTIVQEGYVWVMSHSDQPRLIRLGSSLEQPDTLNNAATDVGWRLDYYARVDDRQQAHAAASNFLAPFRRDRHLYETDAVVAATAIENSSVPIQFRKTSFSNTEDDSVAADATVSQPVMDSEESAETRAVRQRAMAKLLFDAEQLLEDSELVTGPISYERAFPSPQPDTEIPTSAIPANRPAAPEKAPAPPKSAESASDALTHRSPMNELLTTDTGGGRAKRKSVGKPLGSAPATRSIPPAPPTPPRARPLPDKEEFATPVTSTDNDDVQAFLDQSTANFRNDDPVEKTDRPTVQSERGEDAQSHVEQSHVEMYDNLAEQIDTPPAAGEPAAKEPAANGPAAKAETPHDRTILMQMERLIVQREARQNLRAIRNRIGWATAKGVAFGAILGLILMLALNVPDEITLLIGFIAVGALLGAGLMGIYQSSRLWSAASHWRRIADHG